MNRFAVVAMWSLRALLTFGAIEVGTFIVAQAQTDLTSLSALRDHSVTIARLRAQTARHRQMEQDARAAVAAQQQVAWQLPPSTESKTIPEHAASIMRETLASASAQLARVEVAEEATTGDVTVVTFNASWREADSVGSSGLTALAGIAPKMRVSMLRMERLQGQGLVDVQAVLTVPISPSQALASPQRESENGAAP